MRHFLAIISILSLFYACTPSNGSSEQAKEQKSQLEVIEDAYHMYVIGDWGRNGHDNQQEVADQMNKTGYTMEPEIVISTGDNFYPNGVASTSDPYLISSFENIYSGFTLFCPWYVALGNHDYRGNAQAQIDYTNISQRWNMPDRYFYKDIESDDGATARIVFLDTSPLNDEYYEEDKYRDKISTQDTTKQLAWMDEVLDIETDYKIVVGHHPMYTGGKRVDDKNYVRLHLEERLKKHNVVAYLAGHEHDLQHVKPEGSIHHFVSGAGSEVRPTGKLESTLFAESVPGFMTMSVSKDKLLCQFVNSDGDVIYSYSIPKFKQGA